MRKHMPIKKRNPRICRMDKRRSLPPITDPYTIWWPQNSTYRKLYIHGTEEKESHQIKIRTHRNHKQHTGKWQTRKIDEEEEEAGRVQKAEAQDNMQPIWDHQSKLRTTTSKRNIAISKKDGKECQCVSETMRRCEEWAPECFRKEKPSLDRK